MKWRARYQALETGMQAVGLEPSNLEATPAEMVSLHYQETEALFRAPQAPNSAKLEHDMTIDLERVTPEAA